MKSPLADIVAGVLIGVANEPWSAVVIASVGWATIWSAYLWAFDAHRPLLADVRTPENFWFGSPQVSMLVISWMVGLVVSLVVASLTYALRHLI